MVIRFTLTSFLYGRSFYEQKEGVAMGSPLSPMVAKFLNGILSMLKWAAYKSTVFERYIDDTFYCVAPWI